MSHLPAWSNCHFFDCLRVVKLSRVLGNAVEGKRGAGLSAAGSGRAGLEAARQSGKALWANPRAEPSKAFAVFVCNLCT